MIYCCSSFARDVYFTHKFDHIRPCLKAKKKKKIKNIRPCQELLHTTTIGGTIANHEEDPEPL